MPLVPTKSVVSRDDVIVFDVEADGLNPTLIHCLVVKEKGIIKHTTDYDKMRSLLTRAKVLVGHNITRFDVPVLERLLGIKITAKLIDTLALSWYLYPDRVQHGLAWWGEDFGVPKPPIDNWEDLPIEEYIHRCTEDVKINSLLWDKMWKYLDLLYEEEEKIWSFLDYLSAKMDVAREQERSGWKLDIERCRVGLEQLEREREEKTRELAKAMPQVPVIAKRTKPTKPFKKDGSVSSAGARWFALLRRSNLPEDFEGVVDDPIGYSEPNPGSHVQVKQWLFDLGWKPATFKFVRDKETGDVRQIPQINNDDGDGLCPSVLRLFDREPSLELLDGLGVLSHRISILRGFLDNVDGRGRIQAQIQGLTNTLRFKHKTAVNLPGVQNPYGELIRGCLIADDDYELCGSDMSGLEDRLKQHYIYHLDPDYVHEMNVPDYDPHLSLALSAGKVTDEQVALYKSGEDKSIKTIRHTFKQGNYASSTIGHIKPCELRGTLSQTILSQVRETIVQKEKSLHSTGYEGNSCQLS